MLGLLSALLPKKLVRLVVFIANIISETKKMQNRELKMASSSGYAGTNNTIKVNFDSLFKRCAFPKC